MPKKKRDPKKGTGKNQKVNGRRLYTVEDPKDIFKIKFATHVLMLEQQLLKLKRLKNLLLEKYKYLPFGEQRAKVVGKTQVVGIFKRGKEAIRKARKKKWQNLKAD